MEVWIDGGLLQKAREGDKKSKCPACSRCSKFLPVKQSSPHTAQNTVIPSGVARTDQGEAGLVHGHSALQFAAYNQLVTYVLPYKI